MPTSEKQFTTAAFIHSRLDDLGLSHVEFRVYCHATRRAGESRLFYESVPNCAAFCGIKKTTARAALQRLTALGLLELVDSPTGKVWKYRVTQIEEWKIDPVSQTDGVLKSDGVSQTDGGRNGHAVSQTDSTPPFRGTQTPPFRGTPKVIPEGNPIKGERPLADLEDWQLNKDLLRVSAQLTAEHDSTKPNPAIVEALRSQKKALRAELARRGVIKN